MESQGPRHVPVWIYLVSFVVLGSALSMAGPALSHLRDRVGTDDGGISLVFVGSSSGYMLGSFLGGRFLDRGHGHQVWAACMVDLRGHHRGDLTDPRPRPACRGLRRARSRVRCRATSPGNTLVVWSRPESPGAALNALHLFFAIGALSAPLLTNRAIAWSDSLWPVAVPLAITDGDLLLRAADDAGADEDRAARPHPRRRGGRVGSPRPVARRRVCSSSSTSPSRSASPNWIHSYVEQIGYGGANTATGVTVTFWVGFLVGRVRRDPAGRSVQRRLDAGRAR